MSTVIQPARVRHCAGPEGCDVKWIGGPECWCCGRIVTTGAAWGTVLVPGGVNWSASQDVVP